MNSLTRGRMVDPRFWFCGKFRAMGHFRSAYSHDAYINSLGLHGSCRRTNRAGQRLQLLSVGALLAVMLLRAQHAAVQDAPGGAGALPAH